MKNIFEEAFALQAFLLEKSLRFCFIGGLALQRWGELRTTNDIDLTILTSFSRGTEDGLRMHARQLSPREYFF